MRVNNVQEWRSNELPKIGWGVFPKDNPHSRGFMIWVYNILFRVRYSKIVHKWFIGFIKK